MTKYIYQALQEYSLQLRDLFQKSLSQKNPALFLYQNKTRTPLFMAESLCRILSKVLKTKQLTKGLNNIKSLEDALGQIDLYDSLYLEFSKNKTVKPEQLNYFLKNKNKVVTDFNKKLIKNNFYQNLFNALSSITETTTKRKQLLVELEIRIEKEIQKCLGFYLERPDKFTRLEEELHDVRRKLRWISIYAQSFNGIIVLDDDKNIYPWEKKFITQEEIASPYNKLVVRKNLHYYIHFNKKAFLALSHVVNQLGVIKDAAIEMEELKKATLKTSAKTQLAATKLVVKQLNLKRTQEDLLEEAHTLLKEFFITYKIHELLIVKN